MNGQQAKLIQELCSAVLSGRYDIAQALALQCSDPKPKESAVCAWFDGACWPNQGTGSHGGYGVIVRHHQQIIFSRSVYLGQGPHLTNEVCEYAGIIGVFHFFLAQGIQVGTIYGDSQMVIQQLEGLARAKRGSYLPHYREAKELRAQLPDVRLVWISRGTNSEADALSRKSLDPYLP